MCLPTSAEKEAERQLIISFVEIIKTKGCECKIIKLQEEEDDGGTDGIIEFCGKVMNVEVRRKGFPNHKGQMCPFPNGWKNEKLLKDGGVFLNESIIRRYHNSSFIYLVEIKGCKPRFAVINPSRNEFLLKQSNRKQISGNSGIMQPVKTVPVEWFRKYA